MYFWRFPLFAFADIVTAAVLLPVVSAVLYLRSKFRAAVMRGFANVLTVAAIGTSPELVHVLTSHQLRFAAAHGVYVHPSPISYWFPASLVICVLLLSRLFFPAAASPRYHRWRASFAAASLALAALNTINWCSPGWCERFGFPLPYSWWSDAIIIVNGQNLTAGHSRFALGLNVALFLALVTAVSVVYRRRAMLDGRPTALTS
jgi:hypothetical protein